MTPRSRRRTGRPNRITRADVTKAAVATCAMEGFAAVTMTAIAARLRVAPASLYHHITDLEDLRAALVDQIMQDFEMPPGPEPGGERQWLLTLAADVRTLLLRYPGLSSYLVLHGPSGPVGIAMVGRIYQVLIQAGVPSADAPMAHSLLFGTIATHVTRQHHAADTLAAGEQPFAAFFAAMQESGGVPGFPASGFDMRDFDRGFSWVVPRLLNAILGPEVRDPNVTD